MKINLPTLLTLLRIALIPVLVAMFYLPFEWARTASAVVFAVAALSDWLDGFLARKMQLSSRFGAFLDPVADKLMVVTALILLLQENTGFFFMLATMVIIGREITVSALREWMAEVGQRASVAVSIVGKLKTAVQMLAITLLLYQQPVFGISTYQAGVITLYISAFLTLWSMLKYLLAAWPTMRDGSA